MTMDMAKNTVSKKLYYMPHATYQKAYPTSPKQKTKNQPSFVAHVCLRDKNSRFHSSKQQLQFTDETLSSYPNNLTTYIYIEPLDLHPCPSKIALYQWAIDMHHLKQDSCRATCS